MSTNSEYTGSDVEDLNGSKRKISIDSDEMPVRFTKKQKMRSPPTTSATSSSSDSDFDDVMPSMAAPPAMEKSTAPDFLKSSIGYKMMLSQGYKSGTGLGKGKKGIVNPIEASTHRGKMGIGFHSYSKGKLYEGPEWDPSFEKICAHETVDWLDESEDAPLDTNVLESWTVEGTKKMTIDDEVLFCDSDILQDILSLKTAFDLIPPEDLRRIRSLCNPFEKIGRVFFVNRAALKMANMDAVFDFMFTSPPDHPNNELLHFADVCAGPGGFTEYVLWRKKWKAKGIGFTLRDKNDFKLSELHAAPVETFTAYYGIDGDGDVFKPNNLKSLKDYVLSRHSEKGVHFMMADGGFSVQGQENIQEILSKRLYLCQCIAALMIVREGGNFVVKLFDIFTEFSVGLIYLMYRSFKQICIHKPNTSRPANSERYLICKGKRASSDTIERHLFRINDKLYKNENTTRDILKLVDLDVIQDDKMFFDYIMKSNNNIGTIQKWNLLKIVEYHKNPAKFENFIHYPKIRAESLELWKVPDELRVTNTGFLLQDELKYLLNSIITKKPQFESMELEALESMFKSSPAPVHHRQDVHDQKRHGNHFMSKYNWMFVFLNSMPEDDQIHFYFRGAGSIVYQCKGKSYQQVTDICIPSGTLLLAERVREVRGTGKGSRMTWGVHILDAFCLGGTCIAHYSFKDRYKWIEVFCKSLEKPNDNPDKVVIVLRCKKPYKLDLLPNEMENLITRNFKNRGKIETIETVAVPNLSDNSDAFYGTRTILLMKTIKFPWTLAFSRRENNLYCFDTSSNTSTKGVEPQAMLDAFGCYKQSLCYTWNTDRDQTLDMIDCLMSMKV